MHLSIVRCRHQNHDMRGAVFLRMRIPVLIVVVLLSGCTAYEPEGHCGLHPDHVRWKDAGFPDALLDAAPGWTARVVPPPPGIPNEDPTLAAWNATVDHLLFSMDGHATLMLHPDGRLDLGNIEDPEPPTLRQDVLAALADVTDGNASQRAAWADALLDDRQLQGYHVEGDRMASVYAYVGDVPPEHIRIDDLLASNVTGQPTQSTQAGDWSIDLHLPHVEAVRGDQTFRAHVAGDSLFSNETWQGEFPKEEALTEFRAAYGSLGVGEPPEDARVGGGIC